MDISAPLESGEGEVSSGENESQLKKNRIHVKGRWVESTRDTKGEFKCMFSLETVALTKILEAKLQPSTRFEDIKIFTWSDQV